MPPSSLDPQFDAYAQDYDSALNQGLKLSGERKEYFADGRGAWMKRVLGQAGTGRMLDFGCGVGAVTPFLLRHLRLTHLTGSDLSDASLALARQQYASEVVDFCPLGEMKALAGTFDLAHCNGVFHHIPLEHRLDAARSVFDALKPGGFFCFWENNKRNPIVHFMMSRVPFDHDAITLWPHEARGLLRSVGFEVLRTDYHFVFPAALAPFRVLEPALRKLPLGGQYMVLCQKPR